MNPSQWGYATPYLPLQEANVSEPLTRPRVTLNIGKRRFCSRRRPTHNSRRQPATRTPLLIAFALAAGLSILPGPARSDAGKALRLRPHVDFSIVDRQFSGVYITRNFGYPVYDTPLALDHEL